MQIENSQNRVGLSEGEIVILNETIPDLYHGHVREITDLTDPIKNALREKGWINAKGNKINWPK